MNYSILKRLIIFSFAFVTLNSCASIPSASSYQFTFSGTNCTLNNKNQYSPNEIVDLKFTVDEGYSLPDEIDVIGGSEVNYSKANKSLRLKMSSNVVVVSHALFTNKFAVLWLDYDGSLLQLDEEVPSGSTPTYKGDTPVRPSDYAHSYTFSGWSPKIEKVTSNQVYTAQYDSVDIECDAYFKVYFRPGKTNLTFTIETDRPVNEIDWGDNVTTYGENTHTYRSTGTYDVRLKANSINNIGVAKSNSLDFYELYLSNKVACTQIRSFSDCYCLTSATLAVKEILGGFSNCLSLTSLKLLDGVKKISSDAFTNCPILSSLYIPKSVNSLDDGFIKNAPLLESIVVDKENETYTSGDNCNMIMRKSNGELVLGCCTTKLTSEIYKINNYSFYNCLLIESISLTGPSSFRGIGKYAFAGCISLINVKFNYISIGPDGIGESAFEDCTSLTSVDLREVGEVPKGGKNMFKNCSSNLRIIVNSKLVEQYKNAEYWKDYQSYIFGA